MQTNCKSFRPECCSRRRVLVYQTRRGAAAHQRARNRLAKSEELGDLMARHADVSVKLGEVLAALRGQDFAPA